MMRAADYMQTSSHYGKILTTLKFSHVHVKCSENIYIHTVYTGIYISKFYDNTRNNLSNVSVKIIIM